MAVSHARSRDILCYNVRLVSLPDGLQILAPSPLEAAVLYREIVTDRTYERHGIAARSGDVVFDVGANIGLFSIHLGRTAPGVRLYAFEPIPPLFAALSRNINDHGRGVRAFNVGLADREGVAIFEFDPFLAMNATMHPAALRDAADRKASASAWAAAAIADLHRVHPSAATGVLIRALRHPLARFPALAALAPAAVALDIRRRVFLKHYQCRLTTLPAAMDEARVDRVDLLKVDVEGAEEAVLAGIDDRTWGRIRQLVIEVHDINGRLDRLRTMLEGHGYRTTSAREDWALHELLGIHTLYAIRT
jgi:FkbM family methyltransferase